MKRHVLLGAIVLATTFVFASCGNRSPKQEAQPEETPATAESSVVEINYDHHPNRLLLIVDPQNDFVKGGALATEKGAEALDCLAKALEAGAWKNYKMVVATQDAHPANHCSFVEQGGPFPPHCVKDSHGMEVYAPLNAMLDEMNEKCFSVHLMEKGTLADREEFSIFQNDINGPRLRRTIEEFEKFEGIDVCGIATDYCVYETTKDLMEFYPAKQIRIVTNCIAAVDENDTKLADLMKENGIEGIEF